MSFHWAGRSLSKLVLGFYREIDVQTRLWLALAMALAVVQTATAQVEAAFGIRAGSILGSWAQLRYDWCERSDFSGFWGIRTNIESSPTITINVFSVAGDVIYRTEHNGEHGGFYAGAGGRYVLIAPVLPDLDSTSNTGSGAMAYALVDFKARESLGSRFFIEYYPLMVFRAANTSGQLQALIFSYGFSLGRNFFF
jgi:hypothetical protein